MDNNYAKLITEFQRIKQKGWICSSSKSSGAAGITFEKELGCKENNSFYPDFYDIEIKCVSKDTLYPLTLFSISFDGPSARELNRVVDLYGYPDTTFKNRKILSTYLNCKRFHLVNEKYNFKLEIDRNDEKIYLVISNKNNEIIDRVSYINFATLKNRLMTKMKNLAFVYCDRCFENKHFYFKYTDILLFKLKDFNVFLELLENDEILASIGYLINKSTSHYGKSSSKNIVFTISLKKISKLFEKINYDL